MRRRTTDRAVIFPGRRGWWAAGLCLFVLVVFAVSPRSARAGTEGVKPVVMILLDTSGSMEFSADSGLIETLPTCHATKQPSFDYSKSRWIVATEVLTGSFNEYWCSYDTRLDDTSREDYSYPIWHVVPHGSLVSGDVQQPNGLLDLHRDDVKFGLMTFDPLPAIAQDVTGGFSYGENQVWSGYITNLGARNEDAPWGSLVVPPRQDNLAQVRKTNDDIQEQILLSTPYYSTPTAPLLEDALYMFENDERIMAYDSVADTGDPYYDCRTKAIVLITDGLPNVGEGALGYSSSVSAAADLLEEGIKTYVVGFQMPESTFPVLDAVASAGGTDTAFRALSQSELTAVLGQVLVEVKGMTPARASSVFSNRTMNADDKQYQFFASYGGTVYTPLDEVGFLDQYIYRCDSGCEPPDWEGGASLCEIFSIDEALNVRSAPRNLYTQLEGVAEIFSIDNADLTADALDIPTSGDLPKLDPSVVDGTTIYTGYTLGNASSPAVREEYRKQLIRLLRADAGSRRENARMGAVHRSRPVIQPNLFSFTVPIPSFNAYRLLEEVYFRPTVLFVGSHDGFMHAFRVDRWEGNIEESEYGDELWAFMPKHLMEKANNLATGMDYLLDGRPVVQEIRMYKDDVGVDIETEVERWKSVLISGYGTGGRGYFALDVTEGDDFSFMWEVSNTERCFSVENGPSGCAPTGDFGRLGYSRSEPVMGSLFFEYQGTLQERAVALFGGGEAVGGEPESGKSFYVVDLATGELIQEFCNSCGNVVDENAVAHNNELFECALTGAVAAYDDSIGGLMSRAYIGDDCGQLWRIDMTSMNPSEWVMEFFYDAFNTPLKANQMKKRRPLRRKPSLAISDKRGFLVIVGGTGDPDVPSKPQAKDRVFSLTEQWDSGDWSAFVNWEHQLDKGEVFTAEPVIFDKTAYFTTETAGAGLCDIGLGRVWGVHYTGYEPNSTDDLEPLFDLDGDATTQDDLALYLELTDSEIYGVQLVQRSSCLDAASNYTPWSGTYQDSATNVPSGGNTTFSGTTGGPTFSGASSAPMELVVQTGNKGQSEAAMSAPSGGGLSSTGNKITRKVTSPSQSLFSMSWGLLFD